MLKAKSNSPLIKKTMANNEHLNTAKFYTYSNKLVDSYDFDTDATDSKTLCDIIKYAYTKNVDIYISDRLYYQGINMEFIRKIVINDGLEIRIC